MFLFVLFLLTGCKGHDIHVCSTLKTEYPKKIECTDCSHDVSSGGIICTYILMHICDFDVQEKWAKNLYLACLCYGRTVS